MAEIQAETWAIVELMGHVRLAGKLTEQELFGAKLGRVDIPQEDGGYVTQYFGGNSVYRITPVTEETARLMSKSNTPEPPGIWDIRQQVQRQLFLEQQDESEFEQEEELPY